MEDLEKVDKPSDEEEKEAAVIAKENKKANQNAEVTPAKLAHKLVVSQEKHEQSNQEDHTEKYNQTIVKKSVTQGMKNSEKTGAKKSSKKM